MGKRPQTCTCLWQKQIILKFQKNIYVIFMTNDHFNEVQNNVVNYLNIYLYPDCLF